MLYEPGDTVGLSSPAGAIPAGLGTSGFVSCVLLPVGDGIPVFQTTDVEETAPGIYRATFVLPDLLSGDYQVHWAAPPATVVDAEVIHVLGLAPPSIRPLLASVEDLKSRIRALGAAGTSALTPSDDDELERLLEAASSRILEAAAERTLQPLRDPLELAFHLPWGQRVVRVPDLRGDALSATLDGVDLDVTRWSYRRRPRELCALWVHLDRHHYGHRPSGGELKISGYWGPAGAKVGTPEGQLDVRPDIADAALVWAARAWHNRAARFSDTVQDPAGGVASYFRNLPPDVKLVIDSLTVPGV